jgi:5'-methylthioadenosine phosphorylase
MITSRVSERLVKNLRTEQVRTPFGPAEVYLGKIGSRAVVCINRYGPDLKIPSHKVNHRANIWALRSLGAERVISQNAIGSVNPALRPGDIVIPDDLLDRTKIRPLSLFDDEDCWSRVDMTEPFCPEIRQSLIEAASGLSERVIPRGVFVCTEGPRFETPAEIRVFQREGGDIVGTPMIPEAVMAREAELCYASIAPIINYGAGLAPVVDHLGMVDFYYAGGLHELVEDSIEAAVALIAESRHCHCGQALRQGFHGDKPAWLKDSSLDQQEG